MTVNELYAALAAIYPQTLSTPWDNDGKMVVPDPTREVRRVLCCLDCDAGAVGEAVRRGADVILTHHPLIFRPLKALDAEDPAAAKTMLLVKEGIAVLSFHTRLDCAEGGVNDVLFDLFGLTGKETWQVDGQPMGRIGALKEPTSGEELAKAVKEKLGSEAVRLVLPKKAVKKVALLGGSGGSNFKDALAAGADAMITGEASHHQLLDAAEAGLCLIAAGHDYTERPVVGALAAAVENADPAIEVFRLDRIAVGTL